jgi:uncharacterized repeat protein (TIGR02059 family)
MRKVLMVLVCLTSTFAYATDYYVSSSGNDSANGLSSSAPWQSISKVNSVFSSLNPGDRILFKRGDRFYGSLQVSGSGSSGSPITIGAYGTGANPVITGFTTISGWTSNGGGIYSKTVSSQSPPNMVTVNDVNTAIGRWPNTGFLYLDSHVSNTSITDSELPSSPDWTGAEVVIRKVPFVYDRNKITDHSGSTLTYKTGSDYSPRDGYGYFIQNDIKTLDQVGEWYYDGTTFYMYFGSSDPNSFTVKVSTIDQLAYLLGRNYITFDNISFEGANIYAVQISNSGYVTVQNCNINFTGNIAVYGPWNGTSPYCKITNNVINNSNNIAVKLDGDHTYATVTNNTISNTGLLIGMGGNSDAGYMAVDINGDNSLIQYNSIENTGYVGIKFDGNNTVVSNNFIRNFNLKKNDGGGIYTYVGTGTPNSGQKVIGNIILYGTGLGDGLPDRDLHGIGIYLDDRVEAVTVTNNTVAHCNLSGIYLHNSHEINLNDNTLFDNGSGENNIGSQMLFVHDTYSPDDPMRNIVMNNNIFFAKSSVQYVLAFSTTDNDISSFGTADFNCYAKPIDNAYVARTWEGGWNSPVTNRSFSGWQSYSGMDRNSFISPIAVSDVNKIRFEYNATNSNKIVTLDGSYIDVKGTKYSESITLVPYSSAVLMVDPNPSAPPASPVFVSSSVENAAPSVIEMTYNLSLANIVPAASAFSVQVNSTDRTVSSVSVSGTKVFLTLVSPVAYGNTITVAYTKPSSNPLQTAAGGQAASMGAQTVTNRVGAPPPAPTAPVFVAAAVENATPARLEMTYNLTLANVIPAPSSFSVQVNSVERAVISVSINGTDVLLNLASPVAYGNTVTVSYTAPAVNPLQTPAGGIASSISAQTVTNRVNAPPPPPPVPLYVSSSIENAAPSVIEMTYNLSLANIVPAASAFSVQVNSTDRTVSSVSVSGTRVLLTLVSPVAYGNIVTVAYTKPSSNPLQTAEGGQAETISAQSVTNSINAPPPPPPPPVFVSAVIENATPARLEINYNLTLANIIPSVSSFTVLVNSAERAVSSITISGTKVLLNLTSPVVYGNTVTVAYTKPDANPLQTAEGGQAATISAQTVTNSVSAVTPPPVVITPPITTPNIPPVVFVNYQTVTYSGFEGVMNATGSYDQDNDKLTFNWVVPNNIPVSSSSGAIIKFLAPVLETSQKLEFILKVSDGKTTQSKVIPVEILPYQPELRAAKVVKVEASGFQTPFYPYNIIDGDIATIWSANGDEQWIILELKEPFNIQHIKLAFQPGQNKESYFDILGSDDKENWEPVLTKSRSCAFSGNLQVFDFPPSKTGKEFRFVKLIGRGNAVDTWNYISEFRIFGKNHRNTTDYDNQLVKIYPNPARAFTNILIEDQTFIPDFIRILTTAGKIVFHDKVAPGTRQFQIPLKFRQGVYIVQIGTGSHTMFTQKLVVTY